MIKTIKQFVDARGTWPMTMAVILSSMFLGHLSFLSSIYQPALIICLIFLCTKLNHAKVGLAEVLLVLACGLSIVQGNPLPIFNSWARLGLFCIVLLITTPLISSPAINSFRVRLFNWVSLICVFVGAGSFFAYFLGVNCMSGSLKTIGSQPCGTFGGLTMHSMLLGPLAALGLIRCVYILILRYSKSLKSSLPLYFAAIACLASLLIAASRGAVGAAIIALCYIVYSQLKHKIGKIIKLGLCLVCLTIPSLPAISHFSSGLIAKQAANEISGGTFHSRERQINNRIAEFCDSPITGIGFAAQKHMDYNHSRVTGRIEPGTSYGAIFAMTGILGGTLFLYILISAIISRKSSTSILPQVYLIFFACHISIEGYVLSGGSALCFIFWLCIGAAYAIKNNQQLNQLIA